jgi:hypothetical protein
MRTRGWLVGLLTVMAFGLAVSAAPAPAFAQPRELTAKQRADKEKREKKALTDFSAGKYQEAIDLMAELYADFQEPMYYRNIGRCYQKLGDPDRAIAAFEEFLAKGKDAPPASIAETKELIKQMQELKQKRAAEHTAAQPPPPPPLQPTQPNVAPATGPTTPLTTTGPTTPPPRDPGPSVTVVEPTPPPPKASSGGHTAAWILLGGGAVLAGAGGVVLATSFSTFNDAKNNKHCPDGMVSECAVAADTVKSRNLISTILFIGGAAAAVAGGVALVVSPSSSSESTSSLPNELTVALRGRF